MRLCVTSIHIMLLRKFWNQPCSIWWSASSWPLAIWLHPLCVSQLITEAYGWRMLDCRAAPWQADWLFPLSKCGCCKTQASWCVEVWLPDRTVSTPSTMASYEQSGILHKSLCHVSFWYMDLFGPAFTVNIRAVFEMCVSHSVGTFSAQNLYSHIHKSNSFSSELLCFVKNCVVILFRQCHFFTQAWNYFQRSFLKFKIISALIWGHA